MAEFYSATLYINNQLGWLIAYTILFYEFQYNKVIILNLKNIACVIVDRNAPLSFFKYLEDNNIEYIKSAYIKNILDSVSTHPDMQICHIGGNRYVCEPSLYEYYYKKLKKYDLELIRGEKHILSTYPDDISYNAVVTESIILHNIKYTDSTILNKFESSSISIYNVNQGYTKCATCIIDEKAFITSDKGIYNVCIKNNIDCLLAEKGFIKLGNNFDGFIGGCCGFIDSKTILFCGDLSTHTSYNEISRFASKYGVEVVSSSDEYLTDIGSIIPVVQNRGVNM